MGSAPRPSRQREERKVESLPRVAAVVVTYNRKVLLQQCLEALQAQTHPLADIIVVDNASTDGTPEAVRGSFPGVTLRVLDKNRGGAGGFHEGMRIAADREVDWIWVMDDDAEPHADALEALIDAEKQCPEDMVALASLKVRPDGTRQALHAGAYDPITMRKIAVGLKGPPIEPIEFSSFVGLMLRTRIVQKIGLPDTGYFIWGDDMEYSLRLGEIGSIYLVRDSRVIHHDSFASARKKAPLLSFTWRDRPIEQYWRNYYKLRNRLLLVNAYADTAWGRGWGYLTGVGRFLRSAAAVLLLDDYRVFRLRVLWSALRHGIEGRKGGFYDPDQFDSCK